MKQPQTMQPSALKPFAGLSKALKCVTKVHSYTMDLGFALGLLDRCKGAHLEFCVDGSGYRPAQLSKADWNDIANSSRFCLNPKYHKNGVFHSKAWFFKRGLLLGSANLSIREARENLNFWCWMPSGKWDVVLRHLDRSRSCTIILNLNDYCHIMTNTPLDALRLTLKGRHMSNMVIVSPERPSRGILRKIAPFLAEQGNCCTFLRTESHAIKTLPGKSRWTVRNYVIFDSSVGLHGKAMYGEWGQGKQQGGILYLGSANFTMQGYTGGNLESGVLLKAEGASQVRTLQDAMSSILGGTGTKSQAQRAWATERFDGRWCRVKSPDKDVEEKRNQYEDQDDIDRCLFISRLKAEHNNLLFPSSYGTKEIMQAELSSYGEIPQIWKKPTKRRFASVFWAPALKLKLNLKGGRSVPVSVPPLEGLMGKEGEHTELLELLFEEPEPLEGQNSKKRGKRSSDIDVSIFAGQRVLFPWRAILRSGQGERLLKSKRELDRTIHNIQLSLQNSLGTGEETKILQRKLEIIKFTLQQLRESL